MTGIRAVFFDLDDTLIEFPGGFAGLVAGLYRSAVGEAATEEGCRRFDRAFADASLGLWAAMHNGCITGEDVRRRRIVKALAAVGVTDAATTERLVAEWDARNVAVAQLKPGVRELLVAVKRRYYLGMITDSFRTVQRAKMAKFDLAPYFDAIHISEEECACKPFAGIFARALHRAGVAPREAVMVGDNANADIRGALGVGMRAIHLVDGSNGVDTPQGAVRAASLAEVATLLGVQP